MTASLACSHVKGKVQWVECCATTGKGDWHITGNVQEGTRGSVLVARTWVRRHAASIVERLGRGAMVRVELCALKGLGSEWRGGVGCVGGGGGPGGGGGGAGGGGGLLARSANGISFTVPLPPSLPPSQLLANGDPSLLPPPQLDMHVHLPETELAKDVSINGAAAAVSMIAVMTGLAVRPGM